MTPEQALQVLTDATAQLLLKRADQQVVLTALEVIRKAIAPEPKG